MTINPPPADQEEWCKFYGDPENRDHLVRIELPFSLRLSWDKRKTVNRIAVHEYCAEAFELAFKEIDNQRLAVYVYEFGGTIANRAIRGGSKLSTHAWAASIDLNPETNALGTVGDMKLEVVEIFEDIGFTWGGRWRRSDPMHFQYGKD